MLDSTFHVFVANHKSDQVLWRVSPDVLELENKLK